MRPVVMIVVSSADMKRDSQRLARLIPDVRKCRDMHIPGYDEVQPCAVDVEFGCPDQLGLPWCWCGV